MANKESPIVQDILFNSTIITMKTNEDSVFLDDFPDIDISPDFDLSLSSFDTFTSNYFEEKESLLELTSIDQFVSNYNFDIPENISIPSTIHQQQNIISIDWCEPNISLSFINAPEPFYHVRYLSEVTSSSVIGNIINTRIKTKKNISGRYLKGIRSRYVTIALPSNLDDYSNLFIRVTRLTVPYQNQSFIHPYPLFYSNPKTKSRSLVITEGSSIYFKINKEEIYSRSKEFKNIIFIRCKQNDLKQMDRLYSFDNSGISYPFNGKDPKREIAQYQLKKCLLDFSLVFRSEQTGQFIDTNIFCRSNELIEAEGIEWKNHRHNMC